MANQKSIQCSYVVTASLQWIELNVPTVRNGVSLSTIEPALLLHGENIESIQIRYRFTTFRLANIDAKDRSYL